ncbi:uncharacterized protein LOC134217623 [Armigeres subalbatus]|uniref:uncharacterized protein LOC134217623 n=1 Tax=Armigeres subalbatus TaxID=124917 RepID=UPI002ED52FDA
MTNQEPRYRGLLRTETRWDRQRQRKAELDINRVGLGELLHEVQQIENVSCQEIKGLASRIKRRKHADANDLIKLSYGFQQSGENISEFVRITGAINVLVKEFTGHDSDLQLLAGECLCNLTLGCDVCCEKVATFAGTYLITLLENVNNKRLNYICIWTIQNIISSGRKSMQILHSQGLTATLERLLEETEHNELLKEILFSISLILDYDDEFVSKEQILVTLLPQLVTKSPQLDTLRVLYLGLTLTGFETLDTSAAPNIIRHCFEYIESTSTSQNENYSGVLLAIRIMANLVPKNDRNAELILHECQEKNLKLSSLFNIYSENGHDKICMEILWLLGNVNKHVSNQMKDHYLQYDNFVAELIVPKSLLG